MGKCTEIYATDLRTFVGKEKFTPVLMKHNRENAHHTILSVQQCIKSHTIWIVVVVVRVISKRYKIISRFEGGGGVEECILWLSFAHHKAYVRRIR
jgi:hypothetical protein